MVEEETWRASFVEITALVHSTESLDKVVGPLQALIPNAPIILELLKGHYGNRIVRIHIYTRRCEEVLRRLCSRLPPDDVERLNRDLPFITTPEGDVIVRVDKQKLALGVLRLGEGDDIVKLRLRMGRDVKSICVGAT